MVLLSIIRLRRMLCRASVCCDRGGTVAAAVVTFLRVKSVSVGGEWEGGGEKRLKRDT